MQAFGSTTVRTTHTQDSVMFHAVRTYGWVEIGLWSGIILSAMGYGLSHPIWLFGGFIAGASLAFDWIFKPSSELTVTAHSIRANRPGTIQREMEIRAKDIQSLRYECAGEYSPSGLYARCGFLQSTCILPGISQEQTQEVIDTILDRFPDVVGSDRNSDTMLFGKDSEPLTLGLSQEK